jgi:DNA (cytosine-5)-methyltransferase 1
VTTVDHHSLCTATLTQGEVVGAERVAAFLVKYYGQGGQTQGVDSPLGTVVTKDRFGLVTVTIKGEPWVLTDVGMRMLQPRELARAMGFEDSYQFDGTKGEQVAGIGNAVCPPVARAIVAAQMAV